MFSAKPCTYPASRLVQSPNRPNDDPLEPHHLGLPSSAFKTISKPTVHLAQNVHLSYTDTNTVSKRNEMRIHMTQVTYLFYRVCPKRFSSLWYVKRKPCTYLALRKHYLQMDRNEHSLEPRHLGVSPGACIAISKATVRLAQTVRLSCTDTNTISKRTEMRFHLTHVT
jgi:hypothetical protein